MIYNICNICNKSFKTKYNYIQHTKRITPCIKKLIECKKCNKIFTKMSSLIYHSNKKKSCDNTILHTCKICKKQYTSKQICNAHIKHKHSKEEILNEELTDSSNTNYKNKNIYLIRTREFVNSNKEIYKIGKTSQELNKRISSYGKGCELLFTLNCDNYNLDKI